MLSQRQEPLKSWSRPSSHHPNLGLPPSDERDASGVFASVFFDIHVSNSAPVMQAAVLYKVQFFNIVK